MINTQITSNNSAANLNKNDIKLDNNAAKDNKTSVKDFLTKTLRPNLNNQTIKDVLPNFAESEVGLKLKELINKLLDQINSNKNPNSPVLKQGNKLNLAPNFANELNNLSKELQKDEIFSQSLEKIKQILKPADEIKANNITNIIKNSGVFFEAKLKDALNEEKLPKSFFNLLNTIKSLNSEKLSNQIQNLAMQNLSPKESLKALLKILNTNKTENKEIISKTQFDTLLKLGSKLENFKNYIKKDPQLAQNKIEQITNKLDKELNKIKNNLFQNLSKPQNIIIEDTKILKDIIDTFNRLEQTIKNIKEFKDNNKKEDFKNDEKLEGILKNEDNKQDIKENKQEEIEQEKEKLNNKKDEINEKLEKDEEVKENDKQESIKKHKDAEVNDKKLILNENTKDIKKENQNAKIEKNVELKQNQNNVLKEEELKFFETKSSQSENIFANTKNQDIFKQNVKNLIFTNEKGSMKELEQLSKDINLLSRKINEGLKQLDLPTLNAKLNLNDIKNLENKINLSMKDLANITNKTANDIRTDIQNDIKSTLMQISDLAQNSKNEAVLNQTNRLLAQIEINQLMSLANDSINTYLPFFWDDLEDSKVVFKRGKKDKFFAQIKLEFAKLGGLDVLICLNNEKYIDINIMVENKEFRKKIFENAHELKRSINKAGLLSANFFVGDIIKNEFNGNKFKNYDLDIGIDKKA